MKTGRSKINYASTTALALLLMLVLSMQRGPVMAVSPGTGVMIPLYTYPGGTWDTVVQAKTAHPSVPLVAIINMADGPGTSKDTGYVSGISQLHSVGIVVIGYVDTLYCSYSVASMKSQIDKYRSWYTIDGIFFDEMAYATGCESYYSQLTSYAKSLGYTYTVGNPGTETSPSYVGTVDTIIIYETSGLPSVSSLAGWHTGYPKSNWGALPFGQSTLNLSFVSSASQYLGYIYITSDNLPNPWDTVPSYFLNEVAALDTSGTTLTTSTPVTTSTTSGTTTTAALSISTVNTNNNALVGFYIEAIKDNTVGTSVGDFYTPYTFTGSIGHSYSVTVDDYGPSCVQSANIGTFTRDSTTLSGTTTFTLQGNTNLAFTMATSCTTTTSTTSSTTTSTLTTSTVQLSLTVRSVDLNGISIEGLWVLIQSNGVNLTEGYTPFTYTATSGVQYTVTTDSYLSTIFNHWEDGSTNPVRTLTLTQNSVLTAYFTTPTTTTTTTTTTTSTPTATTTTATTTTSTTTTTTTSTTTSTTSTVATRSLTVQSVDSNGSPLSGMSTVVQTGNNLVTSGSTPLTLTATSGVQYTVTVANNQYYVFSRWEDGSTNPARTITLTQNTVLTAYYSTIWTLSVQTERTAYMGSQTLQISGTITPPPTSSSAVTVTIKNPSGTVVDVSSNAVSTTNGAFSYTLVAGGTPDWIEGTYSVAGVWGGSGSAISGTTTFEYTASTPSPLPLTTTTCTLSGTPTVKTVGGFRGVQVSYTSNYASSLTVVVFAIIHNSQGQTVAIATSGLTIGAGATATAFIPLPSGLASGTYSANLFVVTTDSIPISTSLTMTVQV